MNNYHFRQFSCHIGRAQFQRDHRKLSTALVRVTEISMSSIPVKLDEIDMLTFDHTSWRHQANIRPYYESDPSDKIVSSLGQTNL
jgi:hypothetical protein